MKRRPLMGLALALGTLLGCRLPTSPDGTRILEVALRLEHPLEQGERRLVASWVAPSRMRLADRLLQLSGRIEGAPGAELPGRLAVRAEIRDLESGKLRRKFRLIVDRTLENGFRVAKKLPRSLDGGGLVEVTVEPVASDLPEGTRLSVCLDLVRKRNQLRSFPSCAAGGSATTLSGIQASVFSGRCAVSGCHDRATAEQGLILEAGESYSRLINVNAVQYPPDRRVRPGSPERSYLIKKLRGSQPIGARMPLGGPFLTEAEIAGVAEWIENGAENN